MSAAYRIPLGKFPLVARFTAQDTASIAWDGGYGIRTVETSSDSGKTWSSATLGADLGRYAFRIWSFPLQTKGKQTVMARASNVIGETQTAELTLNPAGYHHNVMHSIALTVV